MSTVDRPAHKAAPPLVAGQRLDRATFHARYQAMPSGTRAELVGGVVYMPSPVSYGHGTGDAEVADWLGHYRRFTKGVTKAHNATVQLGDFGEPQPDCVLVIDEISGGQARVVDGFLFGPPELVVEVGRSSRSFDLGPKKADYERAGVLEYLFIGIEPHEVRWFGRCDAHLIEMTPGADGIYRSEVFPGLWLDPQALRDRDDKRLYAVLDEGLASPEHAAFVARLADAARRGTAP